MLDGRTFDPIARQPGKPWRTLTGACLEPEDVAEMVLDPSEVIGLRHRHRTRLLVVDIDNHGETPSPYWRHDGQSPQLQQLAAVAEAAGIRDMLTQSSASGGLHIGLVLPVPLPRQLAHHVGLQLIQAAGMTLGAGQCELFPSDTAYASGGDPRAWAQSHGIRLPGQDGSALWVGHSWAEDPLLPWIELSSLLDDATPTAEWEVLVSKAKAAMEAKVDLRAPITAPRRACGPVQHSIKWTGPGQTNQLLGRLANAAYKHTSHATPESLGAVVAELARSAPGFNQHASANSRATLDTWAIRWARCCLRRPPSAARGTGSKADAGHNARMHRRTVCKAIQAAQRAAREHGKDALLWSERKMADFANMTRRTARKVKGVWESTLRSVLNRRAGCTGTHPLSTGGATFRVKGPVSTVFHRLNPISPDFGSQAPPIRPHQQAPPPTSGASLGSDLRQKRREHEMAELMAWIAGGPPAAA